MTREIARADLTKVPVVSNIERSGLELLFLLHGVGSTRLLALLQEGVFDDVIADDGRRCKNMHKLI